MFDPFFLAGVAGDPALNQDDHMHPNAAGVVREVARLKPAVEELLDRAGQPAARPVVR
jgi:acyl-CoA thioesterase-1